MSHLPTVGIIAYGVGWFTVLVMTGWFGMKYL